MKILILSLFCFGLVPISQGEPRIWSCVVYAKSGKGNIDPLLSSYTNDLKRIFGYCHYEIVGSEWSKQSINQQNWIMPTREFFLKLTPLTNWNSHSQFEMELYQNKDILLKSRFRMPHETPLYIAGPSYGKGKLIFILEVKPEPK